MSQPSFKSDVSDIQLTKKKDVPPLLNFILETGPLVVFFLVNFRGQWLIDNVALFSAFDKPIYPATAIFMVAIIVTLVISRIITKKTPVMPLVSGVCVLFFGSLTLWLHDDFFIKMKPTFINVLFSVILFGGLFFKKNLLCYILGPAVKLDISGWHKLTSRWAFFFLFLALLNEIVWRNFSNEFWVGFKVFGIMPLTILFMIFQIPLLMRHSTDPAFQKDTIKFGKENPHGK